MFAGTRRKQAGKHILERGVCWACTSRADTNAIHDAEREGSAGQRPFELGFAYFVLIFHGSYPLVNQIKNQALLRGQLCLDCFPPVWAALLSDPRDFLFHVQHTYYKRITVFPIKKHNLPALFRPIPPYSALGLPGPPGGGFKPRLAGPWRRSSRSSRRWPCW